MLPPSVSAACALEMCSCWFIVAVCTWAPISIISSLHHAPPFSRLRCAAATASTTSLPALRPTGCDTRAWRLAMRAPRGAAGLAPPPRWVTRASQVMQCVRRKTRRARRRRHASEQHPEVAQYKSSQQLVWAANTSKSNKQSMCAEKKLLAGCSCWGSRSNQQAVCGTQAGATCQDPRPTAAPAPDRTGRGRRAARHPVTGGAAPPPARAGGGPSAAPRPPHRPPPAPRPRVTEHATPAVHAPGWPDTSTPRRGRRRAAASSAARPTAAGGRVVGGGRRPAEAAAPDADGGSRRRRRRRRRQRRRRQRQRRRRRRQRRRQRQQRRRRRPQ